MSMQNVDGNLAASYALIHAFLTSRSHDKAAAAVKKAAKAIVVLKDDVRDDGASLEEIVKWWKAKKEANSKNECSSNSDSSSDSESSDSENAVDTDSKSSSPGSNTDASSDSSVTDEHKAAETGSAASESAKATSANRHGAIAVPSVEPLPRTDIGKEGPQKKSKDRTPTMEAKAKDVRSSDSGDSDSDSSSAEQRVTSATVKPTIMTPTVVSVARPTKKRRTSESGNAVITAVVTETTETTPAPQQNGKANGKQPRKSNIPFQRIKADAVEFHHERLKDNAFTAKGGTTNDYGARANQDLIATRGDGFRKEKNKKKRGSYRGGEITMQSHSIKFT